MRPNQIEHNLRLKCVRGNNPEEVLVHVFIAQVARRRRVADLGHREQLDQMLHLDGVARAGGPDHAHDVAHGPPLSRLGGQLLLLVLQEGQAVGRSGLLLLDVERVVLLLVVRRDGRLERRLGQALLAGRHRVADELDRLLERDRREPAGVADLHAQRYVGQDVGVRVDGVDRSYRRLDAVDSVLFSHEAASATLRLLGRGPLVHRDEDAEHEVARQRGRHVSAGQRHDRTHSRPLQTAR